MVYIWHIEGPFLLDLLIFLFFILNPFSISSKSYQKNKSGVYLLTFDVNLIYLKYFAFSLENDSQKNRKLKEYLF